MAVNKTIYYDESGKSQQGYNINGKTYKDESGTQGIDKNSYVQTGDKWWKMGDSGGTEVKTPEFAGGWIGDSGGKKNNPTTRNDSRSPTFDNSDYTNQLSDMQNIAKNYNSKIGQITMPKFDTSGMDKIQGNLSNLLSALQSYKGTSYMGRDEATARADSQIGGIYNANLDKTLNNYNKEAISRGMFGQLPTEALKQNAISSSELDKSVAINDLAGNLYTQDFNMARQKDSDYYNKVGQEAGLMGSLHGMESNKYQNEVNKYLNTVNLANLQDNDYYNNVSRQIDLINSKYGANKDQYNNAMNKYLTDYDIKNKEQQKTINTLGAYSNDYQARINDLKNDNDTSNDWQIPYINSLRNDKITGQKQAQSKAEADNQSQLKDLALTMFKELGYAEPWMAEILGINPGQKTQSYINMLADNARSGKSSGGKGSSSDKEKAGEFDSLTVPQKMSVWKQAEDMLKTDENPNPSEDEIYKVYIQLIEKIRNDPNDTIAKNQLSAAIDAIDKATETQNNSYQNAGGWLLRNQILNGN